MLGRLLRELVKANLTLNAILTELQTHRELKEQDK
jgi:hypothetical protein